ncbi:MAG: DUF3618 domain-containing protein [Thermoleophilia bacterium]|nr:DUF3618 domain-containing protein [Thermoleophilia bacterium]
MYEDARTAGAQVSAERTPEEIRADIERTRVELGDTAEALAAKTDVKARASERIDELKANVRANPVPVALGAGAVLGFVVWRIAARRRAY